MSAPSRAVDVAGPAAPPTFSVPVAVTSSRVVAAVTVLASPWLAGAGPTLLWALVALGLLAGVPHGAVDHLVASRAAGLPVPVATAAYALCALAAWGLLVVTGVPGVVVLVAASAVHFGLGELGSWPGRTGAPRLVRAGVAAAGTTALLLPLARGGEQVRAVAAALDPRLPALLDAGAVRGGLVALCLAGVLVAAVHAVRTGDRGLGVDLAALVLLGALAPPLVAFAVWFGGWHALRHTARLLVERDGPADLAGFARAAALPTVGALVLLAGLVALRAASADPATTTALGLQLLLAVTVPHVLVVGWLDLRGRRRAR